MLWCITKIYRECEEDTYTHLDSDSQYDALEKRLLEQMVERLKVNEKQFRDEMEEKVWTVLIPLC